MHLMAVIKHVLKLMSRFRSSQLKDCTWKLKSREYRETLRIENCVNLGMHLGGLIMQNCRPTWGSLIWRWSIWTWSIQRWSIRWWLIRAVSIGG